MTQHVEQLNLLVDRVTEEKDLMQKKYTQQLKKIQFDFQATSKELRDYKKMVDSAYIVNEEMRRALSECLGRCEGDDYMGTSGFRESLDAMSNVLANNDGTNGSRGGGLQLAVDLEATWKIVQAACGKVKESDCLKEEIEELRKSNETLKAKNRKLEEDIFEASFPPSSSNGLGQTYDVADDLKVRLKEEMKANEELREQCVKLNESLNEKATSLKKEYDWESSAFEDDLAFRDNVMQAKQLNLKLETQKHENERLAGELRAKSEKIDSLEELISQLRCSTKTRALTGADEALRSLNNRFQDERRNVEEMYRIEIAELKEQYNDVVDHYDALVKKYESSIRAQKEPSSDADSTNVRSLWIDLDDRNAEIKNLNNTVKDLLKKLESANQASVKKGEDLERMKLEIAQMEMEMSRMSNEHKFQKHETEYQEAEIGSSTFSARELQALQSEFNSSKLSLAREYEMEYERMKNAYESKLEALKLKVSTLTEQNELYKEKNVGAGRDAKNYKDELDLHNKQVLDLKSENMELRMANKQFQLERQSLNEKLESLKTDVSNLKEALKDAEKDLVHEKKETERKSRTYEDDINSLTKKCDDLSNNDANLKSKLEKVSSDLTEKSDKFHEASVELKYAKECIETQKENLVELKAVVKSKEARTLQLENEAFQMKSNHESLRNVQSSLETENAKVVQELEALKKKLFDVEKNAEASLKHSKEESQISLNALKSEVDIKSEQINTLKHSVEALELERGELQKKLRGLEDAKRETEQSLELERRSSHGEIDELSRTLASSKSSISELSKQKEALSDEVSNLKKSVAELNGINSKLNSDNEGLNDKVVTLATEVENVRECLNLSDSRLDSTLGVLEDLQKKYDELKVQAAEATKTVDSSSVQLQEMESNIISLKETLSLTENERDELRHSSIELKASKEKGDELATHLSEELKALRCMHEEKCEKLSATEVAIAKENAIVKELKTQLAVVTQDRDATVQEVRSKYKEYVVKYDQAEATVNSTISQLDLLREENDNCLSENSLLKESNTALMKENNALKETVANISGSNATLEFERSSLKETKHQLESKLNEMVDLKVQEEKTNETLTRKVEELAKRCEDECEKNCDLIKETSIKSNEVDSLKLKVSALSQKVSDYDFEVSNYRTSLGEVEFELRETKEMVVELERGLREKTAQETTLQRDIAELSAQVGELERENISLADELSAAVEGKESIENDIVDFRSKIESLDNELKLKEKRCEELLRDFEDFKSDAAVIEGELKEKIVSLEQKTKVERRQSISSINALQEEKLKEHRDLQRTKESFERLDLLVDSLKKENVKLGDEISMQDAELCAARDEIASLQGKLEKANEQCDEMEKDLVEVERGYQVQLAEWEKIHEETKAGLEMEKKTLAKSVEELERQLRDTVYALQKTTADRDDANLQVVEFSSTSSRFEKLLSEQIEKYDSLVKEKCALEDSVNNTKTQYSRRMSDLETQTLRLEMLERKHEEDSVKVNTLESEVEAMTKTIIEKEEELNKMCISHKAELSNCEAKGEREVEVMKEHHSQELKTLREHFDIQLKCSEEKTLKLESKNADLMQMIDEFKADFQSQLVELDGKADQHKIDSAKLISHLEGKIKREEETISKYEEKLRNSEVQLNSSKLEVVSLRNAYNEKIAGLKLKYKEKVGEKIELMKKQFESEITRLSEERDTQQEELNAFFEELEIKNEKERGALEAVSEEFELFKAKHSELQNEHAALIELFAEVKKELKATRAEHSKCSDSKAHAIDALPDPVKRRENQEVLELHQITEDYKNLLETLNEDSSEIVKTLTASYESKVKSQSSEISKLKNQLTEGETKQSVLVLELEEVGKQCDILQQKVLELEKENSSTEPKTPEKKAISYSPRGKVPTYEERQLKDKVDRLTSRNNALLNDIAMLREEKEEGLSTVKEENSFLKNQVRELRSEISEVTQVVEKEQENLERMSEVCRGHESKVAELLSEVKTLEEENLNLLDSNGTWRLKYEREHATATSMVSRCSDLSKSLDEINTDSNEEREQRESLLKQINTLKQSLLEEEKSSQDYLSRCKQMSRSVECLMDSLKYVVSAFENVFASETLFEQLYPELSKGVSKSIKSFLPNSHINSLMSETSGNMQNTEQISLELKCILDNVSLLLKETMNDFASVNGCLSGLLLVCTHAVISGNPKVDAGNPELQNASFENMLTNLALSMNLRECVRKLVIVTAVKEEPFLKSALTTRAEGNVSYYSSSILPFLCETLMDLASKANGHVTEKSKESGCSPLSFHVYPMKSENVSENGRANRSLSISPTRWKVIETHSKSSRSSSRGSINSSSTASSSFQGRSRTQKNVANSSMSPKDAKRRSEIPVKTKTETATTTDATACQNLEERQPVVSDYRIGDRILLTDGRCGTISFSGKTDFAKGHWFGVSLDSNTGKHDGSVYGKRYFRAKQGHGTFVRLSKLI